MFQDINFNLVVLSLCITHFKRSNSLRKLKTRMGGAQFGLK